MDEKYLQRLQTYQISEARSTTARKLNTTDWYITRKTEREIEIPADIAAERAAVIDKFNTFEAAILGATEENIYTVIGEANKAFNE